MGYRRTLAGSLVAFLFVGGASAATAQMGMRGQGGGMRLFLRPQIGFYIPTENLVEVSQSGEVGKLEAGPSFGGAVGIRFGSHFGLEANGAYVPTTFKMGPEGSLEKQDAKLFLGSALARFDVVPPSSPLILFVNGGVGVVSHGGVAFTSQSKTNDVSGVFGAGAGIRLGGLALVVGADLFRYTAHYEGSQQTAGELKQLDFALKLGLGFGMR
jgi:hypothetical protein